MVFRQVTLVLKKVAVAAAVNQAVVMLSITPSITFGSSYLFYFMAVGFSQRSQGH
jgi:ABC-type spermidine/putrescine transport system permease subunit II